ncbi:MAG: glycosyltransferase family 2 protein, partial [Acetobacteraceae bacterium]
VQAAMPFWPFVLLLGYTYVGYPLAIRLQAIRRGRRPRPPAARGRPGTVDHRSDATVDGAMAPGVSLLVIAYNEEQRIDARIENLLQLDYPPGALEIVIASDGSTDGTVGRARAYEPVGVRTIAFDRRRGKPAVLNELVPRMRGTIVVLADTRQRFEPGTLKALVEPFGDAQVGAVSGELILRRDRHRTGVDRGVGVYWRYEKFLRLNESRVDSTLGATGAIYAIRRGLFEPIPDDTVLDDVVIPARIVRQGYRVLFEPRARAFDEPFGTASAEFARKTRTIAGTFQLFARERWLFNPRRNRIWFQTVSHKGLRLLLPVLHAGAFVTNVELAVSSPFYQVLLTGQILFYGAAAGGALTRRSRLRTPALAVPYAVCLLNWATIVGFARFSVGRQRATWQKASDTMSGRRASSPPPARVQ